MASRLPPSLPELPSGFIERYTRVVRLNRSKGQWGYQRHAWYGERGFLTNKWTTLEDRDLTKMLVHRQWLACRAPSSGIVDRIGVDLDAKTPEQVTARTERYWRLRDLMGGERRPVVWRTPSGNGLRVYWRIPDTPISALVIAQQEGLFADVLRGNGLDLAQAQIEVFPQPRHLDRLPLGARMPLLDPDTLEPIAAADIGDGFDLSTALAGLDVLERWYAVPHDDLLAHLATLPQTQRERPARPSPEPRMMAPGSLTTVALEETDEEDNNLDAPSLSRSGADFLAYGLAEPGTRLRALRAVGAELLRQPTAYDLPELPSKREVAERMARWLAEQHNDQSQDWARLLARHGGDVSAAMTSVVDMLLRPNTRGDDFIDWLMATVGRSDPSYRRVLTVSGPEARRVFDLAEAVPRGASRYKFEVWSFAWFRGIKRIVLRDDKRGSLRFTHLYPSERAVDDAFEVELSSRHMRSWPFGDGKDASGMASYRRFRHVLDKADLMVLVAGHRRAGFKGATRDMAARYAVPIRALDLYVRRRDVPADPTAVLALVRAGLMVEGEPVTAHEAMHALYTMQQYPTWKARLARYKRRYAVRAARIADAVRHNLTTSAEVSAALADEASAQRA